MLCEVDGRCRPHTAQVEFQALRTALSEPRARGTPRRRPALPLFDRAPSDLCLVRVHVCDGDGRRSGRLAQRREKVGQGILALAAVQDAEVGGGLGHRSLDLLDYFLGLFGNRLAGPGERAVGVNQGRQGFG